jgi:glyoxylase-like metal-dependent hydrolase (beta-lactamase superfamily II)
VVSSYAIDDGDRLLLFDPLALPSEFEEVAAGRETAIVLTCPWHRRDAPSLAERLGAPIYVPPPDEGDPKPVDGQVFNAGDRLPAGVEAFPGMEPNDLMLWVESRRTLVAGDTLVDCGNGLEVPGRLGGPGRNRRAGRATRADPRGATPAARACGRARARNAWRADRLRRPRARARLSD